MNASELLARLDAERLGRLAELSLDELLEQPLHTAIPEALAVRAARVALEGWLQTPQALSALSKLVEDASAALAKERRSLREVLDPQAKATVRELLSRPWSPSKQLVLQAIDRPPVRELVRGLLLQTVLEFARKAAAPVAGVAKGLGSIARIAAETAKSRSGALGSLVGAVSGEVERQVEKRAAEVVDAALAGVFGEIADAISSPQRAAEAAELRLAIFDGVLEWSGPQLSRELINLDVPGGAEIVREGLTRWLQTSAADETFTRAVQAIAARDGARTIRELLEDVGQLQAVRSVGKELLAKQMATIVGSEAFRSWLSALLS